MRTASLLMWWMLLIAGVLAQPAVSQPKTWTNPVISENHPDPSVIRDHGEYWAATTSGDQTAGFPVFESHDLVHWQPQGAVFPQWPSWIHGDLWAPELVNDHGNIRVYYAARDKRGVLCVGVATSANNAGGPWTDHGPLVCQPDGSIDPSFVRDEHGVPYLIWKEDGNSVARPTPIWAQRLDEDGLHLQGSLQKLIYNDVAWEGDVVEGPYIFRHGGSFYMLYAGGACCGDKCDYAEGVARSKNLLGPWEKDPGNPIIAGNTAWLCPGHGTAVTRGRLFTKTYFLFHAYPASAKSFAARETLLARLRWRKGWPLMAQDLGPDAGADTK